GTQMGSGNTDQGKSGKYFPSKGEITKALPGLLAIVFPITIVAELLWYIELKSEATFFVDIFIAAVLALIVANFFKIPERFKAGPALAQKWFLRFGIIIYGLKFSYGYLVESGWQNLLIVIAAVVSAILASMIMGRIFGLDEKTSALIGNGTAICGIAAMMATAPSIKAREENTSIAIGVVLFWGTLALFAYPLIAAATHMPAAVYGTWCGAAIHDLPQIIAAAKQGGGGDALKAALMVKMIRIAFIVVVVLGMNIFFTFREQKAAPQHNRTGMFRIALKSLPGFVIIFFAVVLLNTLVKIPESIAGPLATYPAMKTPFTVASLLLTMAITGICCMCTVQTIKTAGMKAMATGMIAFLIQSCLVLWLSYAFFG
ncbi:MAG: putative sulfate exporter family transporter, partial [Syntrophales bacterium]|nr:putative sulfate exporter family transporter [Syntrophales bacterium]